jgi:hypothetical protein
MTPSELQPDSAPAPEVNPEPAQDGANVPAQRWRPLPMALVASGVLATFVATIANASALGWWQLLIYAGDLAALLALLWFRRELTETETKLRKLRKTLSARSEALEVKEQHLELAQREFQQQVEQQVTRLDNREQKLAERFVAFHEWMEFPTPIDLRVEAHVGPVRIDADLTDAELAALVKKDRQTLDLLHAESKVFFDNILQNRYQVEGKFQPTLVRDDVLQLVKKVAQVYNPAAQHPLLETSLEQVLRAGSRATLQCLVILDELPLNVKPYNLASLYNYIRQGVLAYNSYKAAEPYWQYANTAWILGRLALGANPVTLGAWWFLSSIGQRGAKAITQHLVNRQALALLGTFVRVVGYEVAGIYGGDFRHRDANWIYGVELCELMLSFPLSRDSLSHALREIGALQLRNEYDRVFLYRCLAEQISAQPARWRAAICLTGEERQTVAKRLEKFLASFIHGKAEAKVEAWKKGVEERLAVKMVVSAGGPTTTQQEQRRDAVRSLASFLIGVKQKEPHELEPLLAASQLFRTFSADERTVLLASLAENPPFFLEQPDVDPEGDIARQFLEDLATLHARVAPHDPEVDATLVDMGAYLRREPAQMQQILEQALATQLAERLPFDAPVKSTPAAAARAALDLLDPEERARFIYGGLALEPQGNLDRAHASGLWLLGAGERALVFSANGSRPQVLWRGEPGNFEIEIMGNVLQKTATIKGGTWLLDSIPATTTLRLPCPFLASSTAWLKPLLSFVRERELAKHRESQED